MMPAKSSTITWPIDAVLGFHRDIRGVAMTEVLISMPLYAICVFGVVFFGRATTIEQESLQAASYSGLGGDEDVLQTAFFGGIGGVLSTGSQNDCAEPYNAGGYSAAYYNLGWRYGGLDERDTLEEYLEDLLDSDSPRSGPQVRDYIESNDCVSYVDETADALNGRDGDWLERQVRSVSFAYDTTEMFGFDFFGYVQRSDSWVEVVTPGGRDATTIYVGGDETFIKKYLTMDFERPAWQPTINRTYGVATRGQGQRGTAASTSVAGILVDMATLSPDHGGWMPPWAPTDALWQSR